MYKTFGKRLSVDRLTQKFVCFFDLKDLLFYEHHIYFEWLKTQQTLIFIYTNKPVLFLNIFIFEPLHCYSWTNFIAYFIFWGWICVSVRTKKKTPSYYLDKLHQPASVITMPPIISHGRVRTNFWEKLLCRQSVDHCYPGIMFYIPFVKLFSLQV